MRKSPVEISVSKVRRQLNRLIVIDNRSPVIFQHSRHIGTVIISVNEVRSQSYHLIQVLSDNFIIHRTHFLDSSATRHIRFGSLFSLLIFQLFATNQCTHEIGREEISVQQYRLSQVGNRTGEILYQIKVNGTGKTLRSTLVIVHNSRCMRINQGKMEFHLFFRQRGLHICNTDTLRKYIRQIQVFNKLMEIHRTLHFARLFIISQGKHRFQFYVHILILYASAIITCIALIRFRIIGNHNLAIVVHVLVRLLTSLSSLSSPFSPLWFSLSLF